MINTFRYGGHKPFVKDEAIHALELPPREIVEMKGLFTARSGILDYPLSFPSSSIKKLKKMLTERQLGFKIYYGRYAKNIRKPLDAY